VLVDRFAPPAYIALATPTTSTTRTTTAPCRPSTARATTSIAWPPRRSGVAWSWCPTACSTKAHRAVLPTPRLTTPGAYSNYKRMPW